MKLFDVIKKIFKVEKVDDLNDEIIEAYYNELEKTEEVKEDEVVENAEVIEEVVEEEKVEEPTEEVKEETTEEVVENAEVTEEVVEETKEEKEEEDVLTKEVINNSKGNVPMDKSDLMKLHGKEFFNALYKHKKNLM